MLIWDAAKWDTGAGLCWGVRVWWQTRSVTLRDVRYARTGGVELAYTVTGDGPMDVVLVPDLLGHLEYNEETPYEWSVPPQARVGPDDEDGPTITTYGACERGEDQAVVGFETRTLDLALQHRELMTQHEDLDILGTIASSAQHEQVDHEADKTIETARGPILAAPRTRPFTPTLRPLNTLGRVFGTHRAGRA